MSYIMFRQRCQNCENVWNAAFGIVGTKRIATPPSQCPKCGSSEIEKYASGWQTDDGRIMPEYLAGKVPFNPT